MSENLKRKKELRKELQLIEKQINDLETAYLEETKDFGNIFTGWNAYLSTEKVKAKKIVNNEERLFSLSSCTSPASRREEAKKSAKPSAPDGSVAPKAGPGRKKKKIESVSKEAQE